MNTRLGRKLNLSGCFLLTGGLLILILALPKGKPHFSQVHHALIHDTLHLCVLMIVIHLIYSENDWLIISMAIFGKLGVSANWNFLYMLTSEVYPTSLRGTALTSCSTLGRLGGILAPFISQLVTEI